ncbi:UNVERIFIED_CONTAM: hypothetical protein RMT77_004180 [Armadillidium vulgare]
MKMKSQSSSASIIVTPNKVFQGTFTFNPVINEHKNIPLPRLSSNQTAIKDYHVQYPEGTISLTQSFPSALHDPQRHVRNYVTRANERIQGTTEIQSTYFQRDSQGPDGMINPTTEHHWFLMPVQGWFALSVVLFGFLVLLTIFYALLYRSWKKKKALIIKLLNPQRYIFKSDPIDNSISVESGSPSGTIPPPSRVPPVAPLSGQVFQNPALYPPRGASYVQYPTVNDDDDDDDDSSTYAERDEDDDDVADDNYE